MLTHCENGSWKLGKSFCQHYKNRYARIALQDADERIKSVRDVILVHKRLEDQADGHVLQEDPEPMT